MRHLLGEFDVLWVNTIGMRKPRWGWADLGRIGGVVGHWFFPPGRLPEDAFQHPNLTVINPKMYPGFRSARQRRFNAKRIGRAVRKALRSKPRDGHPSALRIVLTTLPIAADLVGRLDADRWVYYCVDDFSVWPGVDHEVMDAMERELVSRVDAVVAVSEVLVERIKEIERQDAKEPRRQGREPMLLAHGVDMEFWQRPKLDHVRGALDIAGLKDHFKEPVCVFFGLVDDRLDWNWCDTSDWSHGKIALVGPPTKRLTFDRGVVKLQALPYVSMPLAANTADVLIMPYTDTPVTRAMQPLKLLEYLATDRPVVVRDLPATRRWMDCCDVVDNAEDFKKMCLKRAHTGLPNDQRWAREARLPAESWSEKARRMREILLDQPDSR